MTSSLRSGSSNIMLFFSLLLLLFSAAAKDDDKIMLQDFSSSSPSSHAWQEMNDPVMGGQSTGTFTMDNGVGRFVGNVAIVPFLQAPGFIKAETTTTTNKWPDISSCVGLELDVESHTSYSGFRISFGKNRPPDAMRYTYGYKADMKIPNKRNVVQLAFTDFTDKWDAGTGNAVATCFENSSYCPDEETLKENLYSIAIWGEGVEGDVDLDLHSIQAYGCTDIDAIAEAVAQKAGWVETTTEENNNNNNNSEEPKAGSDEILLEDFSNPTNTWTALNDPVMGGKSTGSVVIEDGVAKFEGRVEIVPSLNAPGFITMVTGGYRTGDAKFPDVSSCDAFKVVLRSSSSYDGYRISFGHHHEPDGRFAMGYKAPAWDGDDVPSDDFGDMIFPFKTFSAKWDDATGDVTESCAQNSKLCPDRKSLSNLQTMSFWGEGVAGIVGLQIKSISAVGCNNNQNDNDNDNNKSMLGMSKNNIDDNNKDDDYDEKADRTTFSVFVGITVVSLLFLLGTVAFTSYSNHRRVLSAEQNGGGYESLGDIQIM